MELAEIRERDQGRCARCGQAQNLNVHHRRRRSQGGKDTWANLVTLCATCHQWVHLHPFTAMNDGWLIRAGSTPEDTPLQHYCWPAYPVWLAGDGGILLLPPA